MGKIIKFKFLVFVFFVAFISVIANAQSIAKIIAKVNAQAITNKDLDEYCQILKMSPNKDREKLSCDSTSERKEAFSRLIEDRLILDAAQKDEMIIPDSIINDKFESMVKIYPSREIFEQSLLEKGLTIAHMKEKIKEQYLMQEIINKYVRSFVNISPQEVSRYYLGNTDKFYSSTRYSFYVAKSKEKSDLEKIFFLIENKGIETIKNSYKSVLIKIESTDDELRDDMTAILKILSEGQQKIEKIDEFYYLLYLDKLHPPRLLVLAEAKADVYSQIWSIEFKKRFTEWVTELKSKAVIKIYYE